MLIAISACSSSTTEPSITTDFRTPNINNSVADGLTEVEGGSIADSDGDGFSYAVGTGANGNYYGYAGMIRTTGITPPPTNGTATMTGSYYIGAYKNITMIDGALTKEGGSYSDTLKLTADFGAGTLIGASAPAGPGAPPVLSVNATFTPGGTSDALAGSVTHNGVVGDLNGFVSATKAIGAYHGSDDTFVYAGGFTVKTP
ncbi:MAG: hypothetical protein V3V13_07335 [Paracoccaceae bacterium]